MTIAGRARTVKCKPEEFTPEAEEPAMAGRMLTDEEEKAEAEMPHLFSSKTLIDQLDEAGVSWKVYMQACRRTTS